VPAKEKLEMQQKKEGLIIYNLEWNINGQQNAQGENKASSCQMGAVS